MAATEEERVERSINRTDTSTYVVQVQRKVTLEAPGPEVADAGVLAWLDVATVTVPARTKRKRVIKQALKEAGLEIVADFPARALDADSAHVYSVGMDQPEPQLRIA